MILSVDEYIDRIAERTVENTKILNESLRQRRNSFVDQYGIEYTRQGDANNPATFYISISPDMIYLERFEFKLIVSPYVNASGVSTNVSVVSIEPTSLSVQNDAITPNPHTHVVSQHSHGFTAGIGKTPAASTGYRLSIEGIDITPYLYAQHGVWIDGQGIFPSAEIGIDYDILEVASDLVAEGRKADADLLIKAGYKEVQISADGVFSVTLVNYLKYSHMNR